MNYRGRITRIIGNDVYVQVSALAVDQDFGPMELVDPQSYAENDYVLVAQVDGAAEDIIIVGKLLNDLSEVGPAIVLPTTNNSFFVGQADGSYAWETTAQSKTVLGIDALETEVQPVSRGGTGITLWTTGNYVKASGATTLQQRTPSQVKTDLALDQVDNTSDANKPVSIATASAVTAAVSAGTSGKRNLAPISFSTAQDFNSLITPGEYIWTAGYSSNTNAPETNQGLLVVFGSTTTLLQRFTSTTTGVSYERMYNGISWTVWSTIRRNPYSDEIAQDTAYTTTATITDIPNLSLTVPVNDLSEVYYVTVTLDVQTLTTGGGSFIGRLNVDGTERNQQLIWVAPATIGLRNILTRRYRVTGIANGNRVFKATVSGTANVYRINPSHSILSVERQ